jgi:hypothetical protein
VFAIAAFVVFAIDVILHAAKASISEPMFNDPALADIGLALLAAHFIRKGI